MIPLTCDECGKPLKLRDELAGKKIKCPGCGVSIIVPSPDDDDDDERITAKPARAMRRAEPEEDDEDEDRDDGPSKPHPVFLYVGLALALFGLVAMAASIVLNHRNNNTITEKRNDVLADERQLSGNELSKDQRDSLTANVKRKREEIAGLETSRFIVFAVVFGVIFLAGVGVRGYYFIAMKAWKAAHPEADKKKRKKKKQRDE